MLKNLLKSVKDFYMINAKKLKILKKYTNTIKYVRFLCLFDYNILVVFQCWLSFFIVLYIVFLSNVFYRLFL